MRLRETTLTDYVVLRLLEDCRSLVRVWTFTQIAEAKTGADFEMWMGDGPRGWVGLRVQCKALSPNGQFDELHRKHPVTGAYQCDQLIASARRTPGCFPVYLLYVGPRSSPLRRDRGYPCLPCSCYRFNRGEVGNWWLSAYQVKMLYPRRSLPDLLPYMRPWYCVACCCVPSFDAGAIREVLLNLVFAQDDEAREIRVTGELPSYVRLAIEGRLPESADELRRLLEGREMAFLITMDLGQLDTEG